MDYTISGLQPVQTGGEWEHGNSWFLFDESGTFSVDKDIKARIYLVGGGCDGGNGDGNAYARTGTGGSGGDGGYVYTIPSVLIPKNTDCRLTVAGKKDKSVTTGSVSIDSNDNPYTGGNSNQIHFLVIGCVSLFVFVLLCLFIGKNGMTEEEKERKFSKIIAWGKKGGKVRAAVALTVIFLLLSFYYGIGMKTSEK